MNNDNVENNANNDVQTPKKREYEQSGLYPKDGAKAFRIWALLGWLAVVVVALAGVSAALNFILL